MDDKRVVSINRQDRPNPRNGLPPVPTPKEEEMPETPIYDQLKAELRHDPLVRTDSSLDDYYRAHQRYVEAKTGLDKLLTVNLKTD